MFQCVFYYINAFDFPGHARRPEDQQQDGDLCHDGRLQRRSQDQVRVPHARQDAVVDHFYLLTFRR